MQKYILLALILILSFSLVAQITHIKTPDEFKIYGAELEYGNGTFTISRGVIIKNRILIYSLTNETFYLINKKNGLILDAKELKGIYKKQKNYFQSEEFGYKFTGKKAILQKYKITSEDLGIPKLQIINDSIFYCGIVLKPKYNILYLKIKSDKIDFIFEKIKYNQEKAKKQKIKNEELFYSQNMSFVLKKDSIVYFFQYMKTDLITKRPRFEIIKYQKNQFSSLDSFSAYVIKIIELKEQSFDFYNPTENKFYRFDINNEKLYELKADTLLSSISKKNIFFTTDNKTNKKYIYQYNKHYLNIFNLTIQNDSLKARFVSSIKNPSNTINLFSVYNDSLYITVNNIDDYRNYLYKLNNTIFQNNTVFTAKNTVLADSVSLKNNLSLKDFFTMIIDTTELLVNPEELRYNYKTIEYDSIQFPQNNIFDLILSIQKCYNLENYDYLLNYLYIFDKEDIDFFRNDLLIQKDWKKEIKDKLEKDLENLNDYTKRELIEMGNLTLLRIKNIYYIFIKKNNRFYLFTSSIKPN